MDGVLCEIDVALLCVMKDILNVQEYREAEDWYYRERKPLLDARLFLAKDDEMFVVTSRSKEIAEFTRQWMDKYYPNAQLFFVHQPMYTSTNENEIERWTKKKVELKAEMINKLKLDVYFDDEATSAFGYLRKLCPNTKIIKYGGRLE